MAPRDATRPGDVRGAGAGRRDRAHPGRGVHAGGLHGRDHRPALPAVRAHHRGLGAHLGVQRADAEPRAERAAPAPARGAARARSARSAAASIAASAAATDGYVSVNRMLIRKIAIPLVLLAGVAALAGVLGRQAPLGLRARRGPGLRDHRRAAPGRRVAPAHEGGLRADRRDRRQAAGDPVLTTASPASASSRAPPRATAAPASSASQPWDERKAASLSVDRHRRQASTRSSRAIPEARVFAVVAAGHSGHQRRGRLQHDAPGPGRKLLRVPRPERRPVRRRGAQEAPRARGRAPELLARRAAALRRRRQGQGAEGGRVASARSTTRSRPSSAARTSTTSPASAGSGASSCRRSRAFRTSPDDIGRFYVRNARGDMVPLSSFVRVRADRRARSTRCASTCIASVEIQGTQAPGYSSGQALDALEDVAAQDAAARHGLRVERRSRTRRRSRPAARRACSGCRSSSSSSSSPRSTRAGRCPSACS